MRIFNTIWFLKEWALLDGRVWQIGDSMEIESLMMDLEEQYGVVVEESHSDISLGEIVELVEKRRSD